MAAGAGIEKEVAKAKAEAEAKPKTMSEAERLFWWAVEEAKKPPVKKPTREELVGIFGLSPDESNDRSLCSETYKRIAEDCVLMEFLLRNCIKYKMQLTLPCGLRII
jgi:hypothetical protein